MQFPVHMQLAPQPIPCCQMTLPPGAISITPKTTQTNARGLNSVLQPSPRNGCTQQQSKILPPTPYTNHVCLPPPPNPTSLCKPTKRYPTTWFTMARVELKHPTLNPLAADYTPQAAQPILPETNPQTHIRENTNYQLNPLAAKYMPTRNMETGK